MSIREYHTAARVLAGAERLQTQKVDLYLDDVRVAKAGGRDPSYDEARAAYAKDPEKAKQIATEPSGPAPEGLDVIDLAAWTAVGNVLLNLDETLMRP